MTEEQEEGGGGGGGERKKRRGGKKAAAPRDRYAPKKPITAYNLYAADERIRMKKENPDRSFGDMNREIGSHWATLPQEKKQPYLDLAEKERQSYVKDVEKYQKSDQYKKYIQTVAVLKKRQQQKKAEKEQKKKKKLTSTPAKSQKSTSLKDGPLNETPQAATTAKESPTLPPPSRPPLQSLKQSFVSGTEIPVFTEQFLLHNRELESKVRKLRQTTTDQEEENALLSRHVDNMKMQVQRLESDIRNQITKNQALKQRLVFLQETLCEGFEGASLPAVKSVPSVDTIYEYLKEVESAVARETTREDDDKQSTMEVVRETAKDLTQKVRERKEEEKEEKIQEDEETMDAS